MESVLKNDINKLIYKNRLTELENRFMVTKGEKAGAGGGINWKFGINIHTLLYIK